jgi:hypothetical protein
MTSSKKRDLASNETICGKMFFRWLQKDPFFQIIEMDTRSLSSEWVIIHSKINISVNIHKYRFTWELMRPKRARNGNSLKPSGLENCSPWISKEEEIWIRHHCGWFTFEKRGLESELCLALSTSDVVFEGFWRILNPFSLKSTSLLWNFYSPKRFIRRYCRNLNFNIATKCSRRVFHKFLFNGRGEGAQMHTTIRRLK